MNMHTYEMFYNLEGGGEKEADFVDMTEEELDVLQLASDEALKKLETYRKDNKPQKGEPKKRKAGSEKAATDNPVKKKKEKDVWDCFLNGGRTFLPAAQYWKKWCITKGMAERLDAYVKKKQSSTGEYIYTKCVLR